MINLSGLYSNYIDSLKEEKERSPYRLFLSDVGKCPRQVGYRLIGAAKNPVNQQTLYNKNIMFDVSLFMEERMMKALDREGLLIAFQADVDVCDRVNWGGRIDFIADIEGLRVVEFKTVNPNAFNYDLDYPHYRKQAMSYDMYCRDVYGLEAPPLIPYFDRGGTNTWQWEEVEADDHLIASLMDTMDVVREDAQNDVVLYPKMEKVLKKRSYGRKLMYEPCWDCGWCDYSDECKPDMGKSEWAERHSDKAPWIVKKAANAEKMIAYANRTLEELA